MALLCYLSVTDKTMKHLLCSLFFIVAVSCCNAQKFKPALNLTKGSTYYLSSNATSEVTQTISSEHTTINLSFAYRMAFKVIDIADSVYSMEVSYQSLNVKMEMPDNTVNFDSKNAEPQDVPSTIIAAMMNKPFNLEITKTGKVVAFKNFEKMIQGVLDGFPQIDTAKKTQFKAMFIQSFGPVAFKRNVEAGTAIFPTGPVTKDEKWTIKTMLESPAKANVSVTYQLADVVEGLYIIHGEGKITSDKSAGPATINGMPVKYNLNGSSISNIKIDKATGWITEMRLRQIMVGDMKILDNPKMPGGASVPITFNIGATTTNN